MQCQVRQVHPVHGGARGGAAGDERADRVLPGSVEVQVREQAVHALVEEKS